MFVGDEVLLEVSFAVACERLTQLTESGALITTSEDSYSRESGVLTRVGAIGLSRLVRVQVRELPRTERSAGIALRWEAVGPGGGLFPVLDADVRLTPAGEHVTLLSMAGRTGRRSARWGRPLTGRSCIGSPPPRFAASWLR